MDKIEIKEFLKKKLESYRSDHITRHLKARHHDICNNIIEYTNYLADSVTFTERIWKGSGRLIGQFRS